MDCRSTHFWTVTGLVGAFLDLFLAYFLLCASTLAFFPFKFLGLFGLSFPCTCNGLCGLPPTRNFCFKRLLVDCPAETISSVQLSVISKVPFALILGKALDLDLDRKGTALKRCMLDGSKGDASCSSVPEAPEVSGSKDSVSRNESGVEDRKGGKFGSKGKSITNQSFRGGFRRRRKGVPENWKHDLAMTHGHLRADREGVPRSPTSFQKGWNEKGGGSSIPAGANGFSYEEDDPDGSNPQERDLPCINELKADVQTAWGCGSNEEHSIRALKQALVEERAAREAVCLELEKERNASASAADEAMAMIHRLQLEKASVEMEARQYQRMTEEKSAYDAEEMDILKEILLRREREKLFLEKQVEAYKQIIYTGDDRDTEGDRVASSADFSEYPELFLRQLSESVTFKELLKQMKLIEASLSREINLPEKTIPVIGEEQGHNSNFDPSQRVATETAETSYRYEIHIGGHSPRSEKHFEVLEGLASPGAKDLDDAVPRKDSSVHAMHVVSDKSDAFGGERDYEKPTEESGASLLPKLQRNSSSAADSERSRLDTEVELLRERLRTVQEGREKLKLPPMVPTEKGDLQLQLLEDIDRQLWEIRLLTQQRYKRQASLPPSLSTGVPRKRRCRSASRGPETSL